MAVNGGAGDDGPPLTELESLQLKANQVTDESLESTRRMIQLCEDVSSSDQYLDQITVVSTINLLVGIVGYIIRTTAVWVGRPANISIFCNFSPFYRLHSVKRSWNQNPGCAGRPGR